MGEKSSSHEPQSHWPESEGQAKPVLGAWGRSWADSLSATFQNTVLLAMNFGTPRPGEGGSETSG